MKRLVGGDYLLDLSSIELEESEDGSTKTNITESDVLEQLTNLKKYINNPEMAKPVWVKLKNGENDELVIARGTFANVDTGEFEICVQLDGYKLVIFIEFTQVLNSDDEPLDDWYIDTNDAKYLFTSDAQNIKATIEDANFGDVALAGDLSVGGDLSVTGDVSGDAITGNSIIENMNGYSFVLGSPNNLTITGIYAGVVKNGNKITFAVAVNLKRTDTVSTSRLGVFTIPQAVFNRLYQSQIGGYDYLTIDEKSAWSNDTSDKKLQVYSFKGSGTQIVIDMNPVPLNELTANTDYYFRYEFTLLLSDNLIPQP